MAFTRVVRSADVKLLMSGLTCAFNSIGIVKLANKAILTILYLFIVCYNYKINKKIKELGFPALSKYAKKLSVFDR